MQLQQLENIDWKNTPIYELYYTDINFKLFYDTDKWFINIDNKTKPLQDNKLIYELTKHIINIIDNKNEYMMIIKDNIELSYIYVLFENNIINYDMPISISTFIKKLHTFKCLDLKNFENMLESYNNEIKTKKTIGIKCFVVNNINIHTNIFLLIKEKLPKFKNKYWNYVILYQNNQLQEILYYIDRYYYDTIKRINTLFNIITKEILNIYFATRKKQNTEIYNVLSTQYKKILYDLHNIYVSNNQTYFNLKNNKFVLHEQELIQEHEQELEQELEQEQEPKPKPEPEPEQGLGKGQYNKKKPQEDKTKRAITNVIVYNYLKKLDILSIVKIVQDRIALLEINFIKKQDNLMYHDIDTIIMTQLLLL